MSLIQLSCVKNRCRRRRDTKKRIHVCRFSVKLNCHSQLNIPVDIKEGGSPKTVSVAVMFTDPKGLVT